MAADTTYLSRALVKPGSLTAVFSIWVQKEDAYLKSRLILGDFVDKRLPLDVVLRYELCEPFKMWFLAAKHYCGVLLQKEWQL